MDNKLIEELGKAFKIIQDMFPSTKHAEKSLREFSGLLKMKNIQNTMEDMARLEELYKPLAQYLLPKRFELEMSSDFSYSDQMIELYAEDWPKQYEAKINMCIGFNITWINKEDNMQTAQREILDDIKMGILQQAVQKAALTCNNNAYASGWWKNLQTGEQMTTNDRGIDTIFMLFVTEIAEGYEGYRKNLQDDHLPQYLMQDVEVADLFIRVCDYMGQRTRETGGKVNFGDIVAAKLEYNMNRADHKMENRLKDDGKKL